MSNLPARITESDTAVGWTRTTAQALVTAFLVWAAANVFETNLDVADPIFILIAGLAGGVVWRGSMVLADRMPWLGYVLFVVNKAPGYADPPPVNPAIQEAPPED